MTFIRSFVLISLVLSWLTACDSSAPYQPRGEEVFPPVALADSVLWRIDRPPISPGFFRDRWTWVGFGEAACDSACQQRLQLLGEAAKAEAQSLFAVMDIAEHTRLRELATQHPEVAIAMGTTAASFDDFYRRFETEPDAQQSRLFLISPQAELVYSVAVADLESDSMANELKAAASPEQD